MGQDIYYLFDTGPLLCFGACTEGPRLLRERYEGRAGIVVDIDRELTGLQYHHERALANAAKRAATSFRWLDRIVVDDEAVMDRAEDLRVRLKAFKRHPVQDDPNGRKDWGECVTLAHAETIQSSRVVLVVSNDDAARDLAAFLTIPVASAVDVLRGMVRDAALTKRQAFRMHREIIAATLDAGDVITSANDF